MINLALEAMLEAGSKARSQGHFASAARPYDVV